MFGSAIESSIAENVSAEISQAAVSMGDALGYSGLGIGIVFAVLVVLMAFIAVMSFFLKGNSKAKAEAPKAVKAEKEEKKAPASAPVSQLAPAPATVPAGAMFVTLGGKRHTVTVVEKIPQFTVKLNGKTHHVDVEPVEEDN